MLPLASISLNQNYLSFKNVIEQFRPRIRLMTGNLNKPAKSKATIRNTEHFSLVSQNVIHHPSSQFSLQDIISDGKQISEFLSPQHELSSFFPISQSYNLSFCLIPCGDSLPSTIFFPNIELIEPSFFPLSSISTPSISFSIFDSNRSNTIIESMLQPSFLFGIESRILEDSVENQDYPLIDRLDELRLEDLSSPSPFKSYSSTFYLSPNDFNCKLHSLDSLKFPFHSHPNLNIDSFFQTPDSTPLNSMISFSSSSISTSSTSTPSSTPTTTDLNPWKRFILPLISLSSSSSSPSSSFPSSMSISEVISTSNQTSFVDPAICVEFSSSSSSSTLSSSVISSSLFQQTDEQFKFPYQYLKSTTFHNLFVFRSSSQLNQLNRLSQSEPSNSSLIPPRINFPFLFPPSTSSTDSFSMNQYSNPLLHLSFSPASSSFPSTQLPFSYMYIPLPFKKSIPISISSSMATSNHPSLSKLVEIYHCFMKQQEMTTESNSFPYLPLYQFQRNRITSLLSSSSSSSCPLPSLTSSSRLTSFFKFGFSKPISFPLSNSSFSSFFLLPEPHATTFEPDHPSSSSSISTSLSFRFQQSQRLLQSFTHPSQLSFNLSRENNSHPMKKRVFGDVIQIHDEEGDEEGDEEKEKEKEIIHIVDKEEKKEEGRGKRKFENHEDQDEDERKEKDDSRIGNEINQNIIVKEKSREKDGVNKVIVLFEQIKKEKRLMENEKTESRELKQAKSYHPSSPNLSFSLPPPPSPNPPLSNESHESTLFLPNPIALPSPRITSSSSVSTCTPSIQVHPITPPPSSMSLSSSSSSLHQKRKLSASSSSSTSSSLFSISLEGEEGEEGDGEEGMESMVEAYLKLTKVIPENAFSTTPSSLISSHTASSSTSSVLSHTKQQQQSTQQSPHLREKEKEKRKKTISSFEKNLMKLPSYSRFAPSPSSISSSSSSSISTSSSATSTSFSDFSLSGLSLLLSDEILEKYPSLLSELKDRFQMDCLDFPLDSPISVVLDAHTAIAFLPHEIFFNSSTSSSSTSSSFSNNNSMKSFVKSLSNQVFKYKVIYIFLLLLSPETHHQDLEYIQNISNLYQSLSHFPCKVHCREIFYSTTTPPPSSSPSPPSSNSSCLPPLSQSLSQSIFFLSRSSARLACQEGNSLLHKYLSRPHLHQPSFLSSSSSSSTFSSNLISLSPLSLAHCEFLQLFPTINGYLSLYLHRKWPSFKRLVSLTSQQIIKEIQFDLLPSSSLEKEIEGMIQLFRSHLGLEWN